MNGRDRVVEVKDLSAGYGPHVVLDGVSVAVRRGSITTIVGASGCGKTTLMRTMVGLLRPVSGTVEVLGHDIYSMDEEERSTVLVRMGLLFQQGALLNSITVLENVALPLREHTSLPEDVIRDVVRLKLEQVGLGRAEDLYPSQLSGGMRKRVALARAMALDPEILLCDEPSAGLDPQTAAGLDRLLLTLRDRFGFTIVVVTHEVASIEAIADHVVLLHLGKVRFSGNLEEVRASADEVVRDFFARRPSEGADTAVSLFGALEAGR